MSKAQRSEPARPRRGIAALALVLSSCASVAEAARPALRHYTTRDGLPQTQVTALTQDAMGYLWVGTLAGGLARYNGERFELFDTSSGLPAESVLALSADGDGRVFVGTGAGAVVWRDGRFSPIPLPPDVQPATISDILFAAGRVWLGTPRGLYAWDGAGPASAVFASGATDDVYALARPDDGSVLVAAEKGLFRVQGAPWRLERVPGLPDGRVWDVAVHPDRRIVAALPTHGVLEQVDGAWEKVGDDDAPGVRTVALLVDRHEPGALWMGTDDRGAFVRRDGRVERFSREEGLPDVHVNALLQDREGLVWLATDEGLVKRGLSAFVTWDASDGMPPGVVVFGMSEGAPGELWMAAYDDGVLLRSAGGEVRRFRREDGLPSSRVFDVVADPAGGAWAATQRGLARIAGGRVTTPYDAARLPRPLYSLATAPDGALWAAGYGGLVRLHDGRVQKIEGLPQDVAVVTASPDGAVWCAAAGWGVARVADGRVAQRITLDDGLPSDQINGLRGDGRGGLWVATERGAWHRAADGTTRVVDRRHGLPDSYVYWVGQDHEGAWWFGTNRGVGREANGVMKVYTARDGLASDECNDDGFLLGRDGTVYVSSSAVSLYTGEPRARRDVPPPVHVESFVTGTHARHDGAVLPPEPGPATFRFAAPSFTDEAATRFRYRLVGLSDGWTETLPRQHETTYGGLAAGDYRFEVVAITGDGRVSDRPAAVSFRVRPHWWRTRTAALGALVGLLAGVVLFIRVRERRLVAAHERLERQVAERTEELRRASERLAELAVTDELTGVANRRRLTDGLAAAFAMSRRHGTSLSVALADMDRFKELNDTMGHAEGDRQLVLAAQALRDALREVDLMGRWGGEEFLVILPSTDAAGAREAGERLRRAIEQRGLRNEVTGNPLTVSIGLATLDESVDAPAELVRRADEALYLAKSRGRNRVESWGADGSASLGS